MPDREKLTYPMVCESSQVQGSLVGAFELFQHRVYDHLLTLLLCMILTGQITQSERPKSGNSKYPVQILIEQLHPVLEPVPGLYPRADLRAEEHR